MVQCFFLLSSSSFLCLFEVDFCVGQEIRSQFHSTFVFLVFSPATFVGKIETVFSLVSFWHLWREKPKHQTVWVYVCLLFWFSVIISAFVPVPCCFLFLCFYSITWNQVWWFIGFIGFLCFQINFTIFFYFYEKGMGVLMEVVFNLYKASGNIAISQYWFL